MVKWWKDDMKIQFPLIETTYGFGRKRHWFLASLQHRPPGGSFLSQPFRTRAWTRHRVTARPCLDLGDTYPLNSVLGSLSHLIFLCFSHPSLEIVVIIVMAQMRCSEGVSRLPTCTPWGTEQDFESRFFSDFKMQAFPSTPHCGAISYVMPRAPVPWSKCYRYELLFLGAELIYP